MIEKGFVTRSEWKAHVRTHPFVAHNVWPRIREYVPAYGYSRAEIDALFEPTAGGKKQILYGNVIGLVAGAIPYGTGATGLAGATANLFYDAANQLFGVREGTPTARVHINSVGGNVPALNLESGAEGELVTPDGQALRIGHWNAGTTTFTERMKIDNAGLIYISYMSAGSVGFYGAGGESKQDNNDLFWDAVNKRLGIKLAGVAPTDTLEVGGKLRLVGNDFSTISNSVAADRQILHLRARSVIADGAGISLYGDTDDLFAGMIRMWTNNVERLEINAAGQFDFKASNLVTTGNVGITGRVGIGGAASTIIGLSLQEFTVTTGTRTGAQFVIPTRAVDGAETNFFRALVGRANTADIAIGITDSGYRMGMDFSALIQDAGFEGTLASLYGERIQFGLYTGVTGTVTNVYGLSLEPYWKAGTVGNVYGLIIPAPSTGGTLSGTYYPLYIDGAGYPNYIAGNVGIGQTTFGANMTRGYAQATGVAPTTSPANCFQIYSADVGGVAGKAGAHIRSEEGGVLGVHGGAGTINHFHYQGDVADDGTFNLPSLTDACWGFVQAGNNEEYALFTVDDDGDVTLIANSANVVANADTDANLCIGTAATQEPLVIKNRLGAVKNINLVIWYS